jgi:predicted nucleic acid-binding protein
MYSSPTTSDSEDCLTPTVVVDTNVLINLMHVGRIEILRGLRPFHFVITEEIAGEIEWPLEQEQLEKALAAGILRKEPTSDLAVVTLFAELRQMMGAGEAAALALATHNGWIVASDERKAFRREAIRRLGPQRILTTPGIFVLAIRSGLLTIEEADADKATLATCRFAMNFVSFRDVL